MKTETLHIKPYETAHFKMCTCPAEYMMPYSIEHDKKPIELCEELLDAIETMLWYSPNISSAQSFKNSYLDDPQYQDAIMTYFLSYSGLKNSDVLFVNEDRSANRIIRSYAGTLLEKACKKCQKIVVTRSVSQDKEETKIAAIVRHLRNCISHGRFNVIEGVFVGHDNYGSQKSAVFNFKIETMQKFCEQLRDFPDFTIAKIFEHILLAGNYVLLPGNDGTGDEIRLANKNDIHIRINCSRYKDYKRINNVRKMDENKMDYDEDFPIDAQYIDVFYCEKATPNIYKAKENTYVINRDALNELFQGKDLIDMIERAQ